MTEVVLTRRAIKDLRKLQKRDADRVARALKRYTSERLGDVRRLTDVDPPEWRLRVDDLRARFRHSPDRDQVVVLRILPRGKAY